MKCVFCGSTDNKVVDSRLLKDGSIRRRRQCLDCGMKFTTYESVDRSPLVVMNVFNEREPFKFEKLIESIKLASACRELKGKSCEDLAREIEKSLLSLRKQEVTTEEIVDIALPILKEVEPIIALVYYTQHTDCNDYNKIRIFINR